MSFSSSPFKCLALLVAATVPAALLTGCGLGSSAPSQITSATTISGVAHGGPSPIVGATVNLYATGTGSYGAAGTLLATATTGSDGSFTFSGASTCTSPSQVYITATGGNPGAGTNNSYILMAALGDCSTINTGTIAWVDEVTTVAAAYALSNFISVTGTTVNVGAPINNAVSAGACTGTGGTMSCNAAGLKHAFQNALNLANSVGTSAAPPNGAANFTIPGNATAGQTVVPQALLNSLANSIQVCVNSTGGVATDTTTPCGKLFSLTTPPQTSSATPAAPINTVQAAVNMAKFPENNAAAIYNLPSGFTTFYLPALSVAPHDLSVGIAYKGVTISGTSTSFTYPYFLSLDANDTVYVVTQAGSSTAPTIAVSMTSNGAGSWVSGAINGTVVCQAGVPCISAPDTAGNLWVVMGSTTTAGKLFPINAGSGTVGTPVIVSSSVPLVGVAVDQSNDVYVSNPTVGPAAAVYALAAGGSTLSPVQAASANFTTATVPLWIALDNSSNLWVADKYTASTASVVSELLTPTSLTTFTSGATQTVDSTASTTESGMYGLVTNSSGTAYGNNGLKFFTIPAGDTSVTTSTITDGTVSSVSARYSAIDGNGDVFMPDNNGGSASYTWQYLPPSGTYAGGFMALLPCLNTSSTATTCGTSATGAMQGPRNLAIDSTGSIWVASSTNGNVVEIIGTAAPTWPQLSYLKNGTPLQ